MAPFPAVPEGVVSLAAVEGYEISTYGDRIAEVYDELYSHRHDIDGTLQLLTELAAGGPVLELAIGTGRVAVPLARKGLEVRGIDASEAMVAKMRAKEGGDTIEVTMGDFADVPVEGTFPLIYLVFNTLFALDSQEAQVRCFRNVASHLDDDGLFLVECFVPDVTRFARNQNLSVFDGDLDQVVLDASRHNPVTQVVDSHHVFITEQGIKLVPIHIRYAYPAELDLMAQLARLRLRDRWSGWRRQPFDSSSTAHVSVYEKA